MRKTFDIADGCKKITVDFETRTVIHEYEECITSAYGVGVWRPKIGEVVKTGTGGMFILKGPFNEELSGFGALYCKSGEVVVSTCRAICRITEACPTTHAERCSFFEALDKAGYKWNSKKMELTKKETELVDGRFYEFDSPLSYVFIYSSKNKRRAYIGHSEEGVGYHFAYHGEEGTRLADQKRIDQFLDALHKAGKDWDADKKEVVDYKWKPKNGDTIFIASPLHEGGFFKDEFHESIRDLRVLKVGLIYKTAGEASNRTKQMLNNK